MNTGHETVSRTGRPLRRFTAGLLLSQGFRVTVANLGPFFVITAICTAPAFVWEYAAWKQAPVIESDGMPWRQVAPDESGEVQGEELTPDESSEALWPALRFLLSVFLNYVAQAAVCYGTIQYLSGRRVAFGESISKGFSRLLPVIGVSLVAGLCVVAGLILLVVPGLILACMFYVAVPAAVVESSGVRGSLARSRELTKGNRLSIYAALLCFGVFCVITGILIGLALGRVASPDLLWIAFTVVEVFFYTTGAVLTGVAYVLLRERKEGVRVAQLAEVFA